MLLWYSAAIRLTTTLDPRTAYAEKDRDNVLPNALLCLENAKNWFRKLWSSESQQNKKFAFTTG